MSKGEPISTADVDPKAAQAALAARLTEQRQKQQAAAEAAIQLSATINTAETLIAAAVAYESPIDFTLHDIVVWKQFSFQDRTPSGPFIVLSIAEVPHVVSAADGPDFGPGSHTWGQVLDVEVGYFALNGTFNTLWLSSKRLKKAQPEQPKSP